MTLKNNRFKWIFIVVFVMLGLLFFVNGYSKNKSEYTVANNVEVLSTKIMNRISTTDLPTFHLAVSGKQGELYYLLKSKNYIAELKKGDKVKLIKGYLVPYSGFMAIFSYKNKEYFWYEREIFTDKDIEKIHNQYDPTPIEVYIEEVEKTGPTTLDLQKTPPAHRKGTTPKFVVHDSEPIPLPGNPNPQYTYFARQSGLEGIVILRTEIFEDGTVGAVEVVKSLQSGEGGLDQQAIEAVKQWKFIPAKNQGKPVAVWVTFPVNFEL